MIFYNDITIVGAGIIGSSLAYHLSLNCDKKIMLLDKEFVGSLASSLSAGTIWSPMSPFALNKKYPLDYLSAGTVNIIKQLEDNNYSTGWKQSGAIMFSNFRNNSYLNNLLETYKKKEFAVEEIISPHLIEPSLSNKIKYGILSPYSGYVDPNKFTNAFANFSVDKGVILKESCNITQINRIKNNDYNFILKNNSGDEIFTKSLILANGVHIPLLAKQLEIDIPIVPVLGCIWMLKENINLYHVLYSIESHAFWDRNNMKLKLTHDENDDLLTNHIYIKPDPINTYFGFYRKLTQDNNYQINEDNVIQNKEYLEKYFSTLSDNNVNGYWTGIMPFSSDGRYILKRYDNLWIIGGFGPSGIMHGPMATKILSEWILSNKKPNILYDKSIFNSC